jgi:seryl-tRNA synthetase
LRAEHERELKMVKANLVEADEETRSMSGGADETEGEKRLQSELSAMVEERSKITQAIGDVLRRHRTRPAIGPVLRELPSFDDRADHSDLPSYLASTLDSHFDRVSGHVSAIGEDLSSTRAEHDETRSGLQSELKQAVEHRERWRSEAETNRREKETLEASLQELRSQAREQEERLSTLPSLEQNLATASTEEAKLRQELSAIQSKVSTLESQLADFSAQQAKSTKALQDLWRSIPPLDARVQNSHSDDLSVLKTAFELPRRPMGNFLADITSGGKFTIESLAERIRILLAEDQRLVQKLISFESEKDTHRTATEKAQKLASETTASMQAYQKQVNRWCLVAACANPDDLALLQAKELEERMAVSSNQEVTMLERLNECVLFVSSTSSL